MSAKRTICARACSGHEKWGRAFWYYGATERYVLGPIRDEVDRRRIEEDLIKGLKPRMNDMEIPQAKAAKPRRTAQAARLFDMTHLRPAPAGRLSASA